MIRGNEGMALSQEGLDRLEEDGVAIPDSPGGSEESGEGEVLISQLGIWGLDMHTSEQTWKLMERALRQRMYVQIRKVRRIVQKGNGKVRFELEVEEEWAERILARLRTAQHRFAFRVAILGRGPRGDQPPRQNRMHLESVRLCSFNINGIAKKTGALRRYLEETAIHTICLQETQRKPNHWRTHMSGYGSVEQSSMGVAGKRGLAMAIDSKAMTAFPVGAQTDFYQFQRVFGASLTRPFILGNVYIPHRHVSGERMRVPMRIKVEAELIRDIARLRRKYPNDPVVVMGDFNARRGKVDGLAQRMLGMTRVRLTDRKSVV